MMYKLLVIVALLGTATCGGSTDDRFEPSSSDAAATEPTSHPDGELRAFGIDLQKLKPNVSAQTGFGHAISIEGDTLAIGAFTEGGNVGRVYVFVRAGATWVLQQKLQASDPTAGVRFGKTVDLSGNTLIVGAAGESGNPQVGAAYVFVRTGATWTQQQKIVAADGQAQDRFGQVVRVDGDTAVIGAVGDDDKGTDAGSAYIFVRSGVTWSQQQKITAADGAPSDQFGYGVAIAGDTVAIGARRDDTANITDHGSVYVFVRSGTTWSQQQKIVAGDAALDDNFGRSVALFNQTLLVGAMQRTSGGNGAAYVFTRSGTTWSLQQRLTASDGETQDLFGADVALFGDVAAISQRFDDDTASNAGAVYVFTRAGTTWTQAQKLRPADGQADDRFGQAVDVHGTTLVGGSAGDDDLANGSGAAYVFESPIVSNGSFETGNYGGWTLQENSGTATFGTFGIATEGQTIGPNGSVFDFFDNIAVTQGSPGLPNTYDATDGSALALQLQNGPENHRMFQTVVIPPCAAVVRWDMEYQSFNPFDASRQFTAVNIRDLNDAILGTAFKTGAGAPTTVAPMTAFEGDLSAFAGQTLRLDFEHQVQNNFFDIAWDNIRIQCGTPSPKLAVAPSPHSFGNQPINTTSANQTFTITNQGAANLVITSITTASPFAVTPPALPATVIPGGNVIFTGRFSPTAAGLANGTISIVSNDPLSPATINVSGTGVAAAISVSPTSHDFGDQRVGTTSAGKTFAITNTGTATLNVSSITTIGPFSTPNTSFSIAPGGTQNISGTFSPTTAGSASGSIRINHDAAGSPTDISLTGNGVQPVISVPAALAFGNQRVGTTSAGQILTISNTGSSPLTVSAITTTGPFATPNTPLTIAAGSSANISVTFSPTAAGSAAGTVQITHDAPGSPTSVSLSGTGTQPVISVPASLAFGNQRVGTTSAGQILTISNTGTATLTVSAITTTGPFATANSPLTIAAGASANISVTFSPVVAGSASGTVQITHDAAGSPTSVALSGTGTQPVISVPASLAFGNQRVGTTSAGKILTITNTGNATLNITAITTTGPFATPNTPLTIAAGGSANVSVTFSPTTAGNASGSVQITHDAAGSPTSVSLSGIGTEPVISVPASLAFGNQRVGTTSAGKLLTITNTGNAPLNISAITTTGPFATPNTPLTIAAGGSANISVTFSPTTAGNASGSVQITHDAAGSPTSASLSGTGTEPVISVPASLAFGNQRVGTTSAGKLLTITNTGNAPLNVSAITTTGPFSTPNTPLTIAAGGSANISVTFSPTVAGNVSGTVQITHDAAGSPTSVSLSGTGIEPAITVNSTLAFGNQRVGTTSAGNTFTVSNTGTDVLRVTAITTTGPFSTANTPLTIAVGASVNISVTFSPTATGNASGTLRFTHDAPGSPTDVSLSGTGIQPEISIPTSVAFGAQRVGVTSAPQTITISNPGTDTLDVSAITTTGPFSTANQAFSIAAGGSQDISVTFTPTVAGAVTGSLQITHDAPGSPSTASLTGTGVTPSISVQPSLAFGNQRVGTTSAGTTLTITNSGSDALTISALTTTGPFATANTPISIPAQSSANITVTFSPTAAGPASGVLQITHDAAGSPTTVTLSGTGIEPLISVDTAALDFGDQRVGTTSAGLVFEIRNTGTDTLTITSITTNAPFATSNPTPIVLAPNQTFRPSIVFTPGAAGQASDVVTISSDAASSPTTVSVTGRGVEPELAVTPALSFGDVRTGTSANLVLSVTNTGTSDLTITAAVAAAPFSNTDVFPIVIAPAASANLTVTFSPTATGGAIDTLSIVSDASTSPTTVLLTGTGVEPLASPDLTQIDFGLQRVGLPSQLRSVVLSNPGTFPLTVTGVSASAPFAVIGATSFVVQPNGSTVINVQFTPSIEGVASGTLTIEHDATGTPTTVALQGTGTIAELDASPAALTFGEIRVGTTSATQPITVRNLGLAPLTISSATASAGFVISGLTFPRNVLPNASVTFAVAFAPTTAGAASGSVEIATTVGAKSVAVSATAVTAALTSDVATLDFGQIRLGEASAAKVVTLTNITDAPISVAGAVVSNPQFVLDPPPSQAPVPPGATIALGIRFVPEVGGIVNGQVDVTLTGNTVVEITILASGQGLIEESGCCSTGGGGASSSVILGLAVLGLLIPRRRRASN